MNRKNGKKAADPSPRRILFPAVLTILWVLLLAAGPLLCRHDPYQTNLGAAFHVPCKEFILGTDHLGRCVLCRIICGGGISVFTAAAVTAVSAAAGTVLGISAGYFGGAADGAIQGVITLFQAFPSFVLAIAIAGILGQSLANSMIALCAVYWTTYARLSRSMTQQARSANYLKAAWLCGAGNGSLLFRHLLPGVARQMVVTAALDIGNVVLSMAGLAFLGLGAGRPSAQWGTVMNEAKDYLQKAPWVILANGGALFITVLCFNLLGERLSEGME